MSAPTTPSVATAPSYGGLYGGLAFVALALTGGQIYADIEEEGLRVSYPTLWEMLDSQGAALAMGALLIVGGVVVLSAIAAVRGVRSAAIPVAVVVFALLAAVMLMARVGTSRSPDLDVAGGMMLVTCWGAVLLGVVHTIHVSVWRSRNRTP